MAVPGACKPGGETGRWREVERKRKREREREKEIEGEPYRDTVSRAPPLPGRRRT